MEFRDLKRQYEALKPKMDEAVLNVLASARYIGGDEVKNLEKELKEFVGVKHCISCGNGTDALMLVLKAWGIGPGDCVYVPDFTFFASAEAIGVLEATPVFVDVAEDSFNISLASLKDAHEKVKKEGKLTPKAVIAVDLFGLPADYEALEDFCKKEGLKLLEDSAQGFSGSIKDRKSGSFGDAATTSFFPAKPLGCYGDGGAIFTNDEELASLISSLAVHGKGKEKYDNVRIGYNSRLDTLQAAILRVKFEALVKDEMAKVEAAVKFYDEKLSGLVKTPVVPQGYRSAWAQYTITLPSNEVRERLAKELKEKGIPTMVYYPKVMSQQTAFKDRLEMMTDLSVSQRLSEIVLSLPLSPYINREEQELVVKEVEGILRGL